jgi:hypothetical protein
MALISAAGSIALLFVVFAIATAFGSQLLRIFRLTVEQPLDNLLFAAGIGFAALQLSAGIVGFAVGLSALSGAGILVFMAVAAGNGWKSWLRLGRESYGNLSDTFATPFTRFLGACIFFFLGLETFLAAAPLTGSDAMHYHFTAPLLQIGKPEQPIFWLTHSFFTGLGHELIALGLVLGSDRLSLLMILMSGCLTAVALLQLARRLMPIEWALSAFLTFFMAPMVFWQISTAGSPDIWMGFYVLLATLAMGQVAGPETHRWIILAGVYSGAAAGIKYTGWIVPVVVVLGILWITRSIRWAAGCSAAALITGVFPMLRNFIWTGDPFFPFLTRWIGKAAMNSYSFSFLRADVHSPAFSGQPLHILYFFATMGLMSPDYGLGNYFGPIVLSFLPLLIFCNWKIRLARVAGALWLAMLVANALTTQMARFLLPAFPLALALVFYGASEASRSWGRIARFGCTATITVFALFCLASDSLYARQFLPVSFGLESRGAFLDRMSPDYGAATFVNSALAHREGKALVFFRHLYYLRAPYVNGDPGSSWTMDPERLTSPQLLLTFLKKQDIRWVVKSPDYPDALAGVFEECEKEGKLVPEMRSEIEVFEGNSRTVINRVKASIILMRVVD